MNERTPVQERGIRLLGCLLIAAIGSALAVAGGARAQNQVEPPDIEFISEEPIELDLRELPPEVLQKLLKEGFPPGGPEGADAAGEGSPKTEEEKKRAALLQGHLQLKFVRQPSTVLATLAQEAKRKDLKEAESASEKGEPETPKDPIAARIQDFQQKVIVGDWEAVRAYLADLPEEIGGKVYAHLIQSLGNNQVILLPDDILPLADASPSAPGDAELAMLGRLLQRSLGYVGRPDLILSKLDKGTARLGGHDPKKRIAAARLLLGASMVSEARRFSPPLEDAIKNRDPEQLNLHALHLETVGRKESNHDALHRAWELNHMVLEMSELEANTRMEALRRAMNLMHAQPPETVSRWLRELFTERTDLGLTVLAELAQRLDQTFWGRGSGPRTAALSLLQRFLTELLSLTGGDPGAWRPAVQMLTLLWLREAHKVVRQHGSQQARNLRMPATNSKENKIPALSPENVLSHSPDDVWCRALSPDLTRRMYRLTGLIAAGAGDETRTDKVIRYFVKTEPEVAKELAEAAMHTWAERLGGNRNEPRYYPSGGFYPGYGYGDWSEGIPLTRARQVRNLAVLGKRVGLLKEMGVPPLDPAALVQAFQACHSPAEVYREEDLRNVFGDLEALEPGCALALLSDLRSHLAGSWRRPEVQEQAGTRRTDAELVEEIKRGYGLATSILTRAVERHTGDARLLSSLATVYFDEAEFLYGQKVDLETYVSVRDLCFQSFRQAAELYAASVPALEAKKYSIQLFLQWFQCALGASDLAYLTRQDKPDLDQIQRIRAAICELGEEAADRHLELFGSALDRAAGQVPPQLKPLYFRQGLRVLGDHPSGKEVRDLLDLYQELLREVEVALTLDGPSEVGHNRDFGGHLSVHYTKSLGRESGGFNRFLANNYYSRSVGRSLDYKDDLEQTIRQTLAECFDVQVIRFHAPDVAPRGFGRPGWQETPLAFIVLRAKDPSIDRIPQLQVDLEFNDGKGLVLLPVTSQVILIDARDSDPPPRPARDVKVGLVLDDREAESGLVRLEVSASAKGLMPGLDHLLDLSGGVAPGFAVRQTHDHGLNVESFDTSGQQIEVLCQRSWLVELEPAEGESPGEFAFPKGKGPAVSVSYERYDDADIVKAAAVVPLRSFLSARRLWPWLVGGSAMAIVAALASGVTYRSRKRRAALSALGPTYQRPDPVTPFTALSFLESVRHDQALRLAKDEEDALALAIEELESHFFARRETADGEPDLDAVVEHWLAQVSKRDGVNRGQGAQTGAV